MLFVCLRYGMHTELSSLLLHKKISLSDISKYQTAVTFYFPARRVFKYREPGFFPTLVFIKASCEAIIEYTKNGSWE